MRFIYLVSVFIHIFSVIFWLGGASFLSFILVPTISKKQDYPNLLEVMVKRYSKITWSIIFPLILITGYFNSYIRTGYLYPSKWMEVSSLIFWKFHLFFLIVILSAIHDFWIGQKAIYDMRAGINPSTYRKISSWIGRINFFLGIIMLYLGIRVVRG